MVIAIYRKRVVNVWNYLLIEQTDFTALSRSSFKRSTKKMDLSPKLKLF